MERKVKLAVLNRELSNTKFNLDLFTDFKGKLEEYKQLFNEKTGESELQVRDHSNKMSMFVTLLARKTSIGTNTAEGIHIEEEDITKAQMEESKYKDEQEIISAIRFINEYINSEYIDFNNFSDWLKEKHKTVFSNDKTKNAGKFKKIENFIPAKTGMDFQLTFLDPSKVEIELSKLGVFASTSDLEPIILSAIIHAQLVAIHPFKDGNGRIARLVSNKVIQFGYNVPLWIDEAISISITDYHKAMNEFHVNQNITPIIEFFLTKGIEQINRNTDLMNKNVEELKEIENILINEGMEKYKDVACDVVILNAVTISNISKRHDLHRDTSKKIIDLLETKGIVKNISKPESKTQVYQRIAK